MIKDLWEQTTEPDLDKFQYCELKISFDWPVNIIAKLLNWRKKIYSSHGINIIGNKKILPFKLCEDILENKECIVLDYGIMKDYIRPVSDKVFIGVLRNHKNDIILWFKLKKSDDVV